jgi:hypothetical protein
MGEQFPAKREALSNPRLPCKWQRVYEYFSSPKPWNALEKVIRCGSWKCTMQLGQRQRSEQTKRVEMTAMIRDDNKRSVGTKIFVPDNFKMIVDPQQTSNNQRAERSQSVNNHGRLARKLTRMIGWRLIEIVY